MKHMKIGVIGGGAAGMTAAIAAAVTAADAASSGLCPCAGSVSVTLIEGGERVGKKLLATGNGKCNLGNLRLSAEEYYGASGEWIADCLARFDTRSTIRFFEGMGLMLKEKNGYLYPLSEQAAAVPDVLRAQMRALDVELITGCRVEDVRRNSEGLFAVSAGDRDFCFDRVILACGGRAAPKTGSDGSGYRLAKRLGHELVPTVPALVQLRCREGYLKEVAGVRAEAVITVLCGDKDGSGSARIAERGELQLTDYGISGIPVFQLSRQVNYLLRAMGDKAEAEVSVDLLPDYDAEGFRELCRVRKRLRAERTVEEFFTGMLNKKLMHLFIKLAGLKRDIPAAEADEDKLERVFALCKDWRLHVIGSNSFDSAQVCAGGVDTRQVGRNMESLLVPGLYFAGELLDVDGRCGGYNLQWAWCSGYIAGSSAVRSL